MTFIRSFTECFEIGVFAREALLNDLIPVISGPHHAGTLISSDSESEKIQVPSWCGQEITGIKSLSNASLAKTPISQLSVKDRIKVKRF